MPVIGHAFAGILLSPVFRPRHASGESPEIMDLAVPVSIFAAYLPDIAAQSLSLVTDGEWVRIAAHSLVLAPIGAYIASRIIAAILRTSIFRTFECFLTNMACHDILDILQSTDRHPFWPLSSKTVDLPLLPVGPMNELAVFGCATILIFALFLTLRRTRGGTYEFLASSFKNRSARTVTAGRFLTVCILVAALGTHSLRELRERELEKARASLWSGNYREALVSVEFADRWPATTRPGRTDLIRAEAYEGTGDRDRAKLYFLRARRLDPSYFWATADLALFFASSDKDPEARRGDVAPYLDILRREFAMHPDIHSVIGQIERKLSTYPRPTPARDPAASR